MFIASILRIILVLLAVNYVWKAVKRSFRWSDKPRQTPPPPESTSFDHFEEVEDIDYEEIE